MAAPEAGAVPAVDGGVRRSRWAAGAPGRPSLEGRWGGGWDTRGLLAVTSELLPGRWRGVHVAPWVFMRLFWLRYFCRCCRDCRLDVV